jgi:hypothetical protein
MLRRALFLSVLALPTLSIACGSDDDGGGDGGLGTGASKGSSTGTGGTIDVGSGGSSGNGIPGKHNGGTVDLTEDQVEIIQNSACAGWTTEGENLPAVIQLVVDTSLSMRDRAPGSNNSKWEVTRDALLEALDGLSPQTAVGLLFYPNRSTGNSNQPRPDSACLDAEDMIPIAMLGADNSQHRRALERALERARPNGATPTHVAYRYAYENGMRPFMTSANRFMLLITDGAPTLADGCVGNPPAVVDTQPIIDEIKGAADDGVRTFIIGSPGSEENSMTGGDMRPWLSKAAMVGGTAAPNCTENGPNFCHMDMTQEPDFAAALRAGLGAIAGQLNSCTYAIPKPPEGKTIDLSQVNLMVNSPDGTQLILPDNEGDCSEGWQLDDENQIVLCEDTCKRVQENVQARVELLFGCASGEIPVTK